MAPLTTTNLGQWTQEFSNDLNTQLAGTVLGNFNADELLINREVAIRNTTTVFNTSVKTEGAPVTNQKSSGRCWLFASGNVLRIPFMEKLNLKEFQFSQSYWFFYDKLEKCNFFLEKFAENMNSDLENDIDSRLNQHLLTDPTCDGGQFDMFVNVIEKYGMVPHDLYPDCYTATSSHKLNFLLMTKLREYAQQLKNHAGDSDKTQLLLAQMQKELYRMMVLFLGQPPAPLQQLVWDYKDKDGKVDKLCFTPILMYRDILKIDVSSWVSLLNDPRNSYDSLIKIDRLGNVVGAKEVSYVNVDQKLLAQYAVQRIQSNQAVFFGTHTPIFMDKKRGIMDESLYNYKLMGFESKQDKASRIQYKQSLMTHAMVLTAVHLDEDGNPIRWRVENSWGKDSGQDGYYVMDHEYFNQYVYQIVVEASQLLEKHREVLKSENPIVLPPWDPMGALAVFRNEVENEN